MTVAPILIHVESNLSLQFADMKTIAKTGLHRSLSAICVFAVAAGLWSCASRDDAVALEGKEISRLSIRFTHPTGLTEARIRQMIRSQPGTKYDSARISEDIRTIYESGCADDIHFLAEPDGLRVRLTAEVLSHPPCGPDGFVGNSAFSSYKLAAVTGLKAGKSLTDADIAAACRNIGNFYRQHGYRKARVTSRQIPGLQPGLADLQFLIHEGPQTPGGR